MPLIVTNSLFNFNPSPRQHNVRLYEDLVGFGYVCCCCSEWQSWCYGTAVDSGCPLDVPEHYGAFLLHYTAQETREPLHNGNVSIPSLFNRFLCISVFLQSRLIVLERLLHYTVLHNSNMFNVASFLDSYHSNQCYKWSGNKTMQWLAILIPRLSPFFFGEDPGQTY